MPPTRAGPADAAASDRDRRSPIAADGSPRTPTRATAKPVSQTVRDPATPSPLDFSLLPEGQRPRMVGSRTFELEYELESVGASGVGKIELWGTLDGGRTWSVYGVDADNHSPLPVRVEYEGIYGFRIVVQSGSGLGGQPPTAGDTADVWIGVDLAKPVARITAAEVSDDGAELVITWEAGDDVLDVRPVSLEFAADPTRPVDSHRLGTGEQRQLYLAHRRPRAAGDLRPHDSARRSGQRGHDRLGEAGLARPQPPARAYPQRPPVGAVASVRLDTLATHEGTFRSVPLSAAARSSDTFDTPLVLRESVDSWFSACGRQTPSTLRHSRRR